MARFWRLRWKVAGERVASNLSIAEAVGVRGMLDCVDEHMHADTLYIRQEGSAHNLLWTLKSTYTHYLLWAGP